MNKILKADKTIFIVIILLMLISALAAGTAHSTMAIGKSDFSFIHLIKQIFYSGLALAAIFIFANIPYQFYSKFANQIYFIALALMLITIIAGVSANEAKRWLYIPIIGLTIQTSDFARIAMIFIVAKLISQKKPFSPGMDLLMQKIIILTAPMILLITYGNLSTGLISGLVVITMIFLTSIQYKIFFKKIAIYSLIFIGIIAFLMIFEIGRGKTWKNRLLKKETNTAIYSQKTQGKIAIANAPFLIPKPGSSKQKYVLDNSYSDYIFDILIEEYGLIGAVVILLLYVILFYRIFLIIKRQNRTFPLYLSLGLALNLMIQTFVHIYVNLGIGPVTGQPLPFISMGGSSTISTALQFAIIINISYATKTQETKPESENIYIEDEETILDTLTEKVAEPKAEEIKINDHPILIG